MSGNFNEFAEDCRYIALPYNDPQRLYYKKKLVLIGSLKTEEKSTQTQMPSEFNSPNYSPLNQTNCHWVTLQDGRHVLISDDNRNIKQKIPYSGNVPKNTIDKNIKDAYSHRSESMAQKSTWFISMVQSGGQWDYKQGGKFPDLENFGNFNYGATGRALGFSSETLLKMAGLYQIWKGTSSLEFYNSSFDDPKDQEMIKHGIEYYNINYGG